MENDFSMLLRFLRSLHYGFFTVMKLLVSKTRNQNKTSNAIEKKMTFQSNANCLLADSVGYTVNKFEYVWGGCTVRSKFKDVKASRSRVLYRYSLRTDRHG